MSIKLFVHRAIDLSERVGLRGKRSFLRNSRLGRVMVDIVLLPSDLRKVAQGYRSSFGSYPNLIRPRNFNEYLQRSKLLKRKSRYTRWADKLSVREYVEGKIGAKYLVPLLWTGDDIRLVDKSSLPSSFIIKTNQGSGTNIIVKDKCDFDWEAAHLKISQWLLNDHSVAFAEWQYRWIRPKILVEKLLVGRDGGIPVDYKFFVFYGRVEFVQVDFDRFSRHTRNIYDRAFKRVDVEFKYPNYTGEFRKPPSYEEMIGLAEILSDGEPFVRVDFYDVGGPVFGEITLHPEAGFGRFNPESFNELLGRLASSEYSEVSGSPGRGSVALS